MDRHGSPHPDRDANYRGDIDGLRAVAVLGVLIFHAWPSTLSGGFAGVDVFFVISGFLISGIILRALRHGRFSVIEFYARRIKRIFPALIAMLLVIWALAWPALLSDEYQRLGKHIVAGAGFALNLVLYADFNLYFGVTTSPLIHLWSLGVEEQFYIFWPMFLLVLWKWLSERGRLVAITAVAALSFAINIWAVSSDPTASFYLPSSRMWELAVGALLAYVEIQRAGRGTGRWSRAQRASRHCIGVAGLVMIIAAFVRLDSSLSFPGWWALLPCLGAALVIAVGADSWANRHILGSTPMTFIGLISYPLYLWHWPLLSMVHIVGWQQPTMIVAAVTAAFVLAFLTYRYVEMPIRSSSRTPQLAAALGMTMAVCAAVGLMTAVGVITPRSHAYDLDRFVKATREDWLSEQRSDWTWFTGLLQLGAGPRRVLFIGDSNMQQYYPRIARLMRDHPSNQHGATFAVRPGCAPVVIELGAEGANPDYLAGCREFLQRALEYAQRPEVDTIVIAAYWRGYVISGATNIADFRVLPLRPNTDVVLAELGKLLGGFVAQGKRVYVVLNIPTSPSFDPRQMIRRNLGYPAFTVDIHDPGRDEVEAVIGPVNAKLRRVAHAAGAETIDPVEALCDTTRCSAVTADGSPIYRDFGHLRPSYVRDRVAYLDSTILEDSTLQSRAGR